eukprot:4828010-Karenia_brevis.AAC.1
MSSHVRQRLENSFTIQSVSLDQESLSSTDQHALLHLFYSSAMQNIPEKGYPVSIIIGRGCE